MQVHALVVSQEASVSACQCICTLYQREIPVFCHCVAKERRFDLKHIKKSPHTEVLSNLG